MSKWILIIIFGFGASAGGMATAEFDDKQACYEALEQAKGLTPGEPGLFWPAPPRRSDVRGVCVVKSTTFLVGADE